MLRIKIIELLFKKLVSILLIVRFILLSLITASYILSSGFSDRLRNLGPVVTVEIVHSHKVASQHHHHDLNEHDDSVEDHDHSESQSNNKEHHDKDTSAPHSHKISISMSNSYVMTSSQITGFKATPTVYNVSFSIYNDLPPQSPILGTIFRPPIS